MAVTVNIFNPNQFTIRVSVNRGNEFDIPAAGPAQNWQPQQPSSNPISFAYSYPSPNTLAPGNNQLVVSGAGGESKMLNVNIPQLQIFSLQLYIFLGDQSSWTLLNNGQTIASGTALQNAQPGQGTSPEDSSTT